MPVTRISSIRPKVLLVDCKIKEVPVSAVLNCGNSICILSKEVFKCIELGEVLRRVGSEVVSAEVSKLDITGN